MNNFELIGKRFAKAKLDEYVDNVTYRIESQYLFSSRGDKNDIHNYSTRGIHRKMFKYISRAKLREAVIANLNPRLELYNLSKDRMRKILEHSVRSKYSYMLKFDKGRHGQGLYVS